MKRALALEGFELDWKTLRAEIAVAVERFFRPLTWLGNLLNSVVGVGLMLVIFTFFVANTWYAVHSDGGNIAVQLPAIYTLVFLFAGGFGVLFLGMWYSWRARRLVRRIIENRTDEAMYMACEIAHESEFNRDKLLQVVLPYHAKYCDYYQLLSSKVMRASAMRSLLHSAQNYDPNALKAYEKTEQLLKAYEDACTRIEELSSIVNQDRIHIDLVKSGLELGDSAKEVGAMAQC